MGFFDEVKDVFGAVADVATFGITSNLRARRMQKRAEKEQERQSAQAIQATQNQARLAEQQQSRVNQRMPDVAAILARAMGSRIGTTQLTGPGGVPKKNLRLGETSLLGE